ncbi:MAG: type II toxin-antitoxin system HicB family antitoxin [Steroidobacteraceae bacterium]
MKIVVPKFETYPFNVEPLKKGDGGGFVITFPDLPGCMSDGDTPEEAIKNGRNAFRIWMKSVIEDGKPLPKPGAGHQAPSRFVLRLPRTLHAKLTSRASIEGVSLNSLVQVYVAEAVGRREGRVARNVKVAR